MFGKINSSICFLRADLANYVEFVIWRFKGWQKCEGTQAASSQLRTEIRLRIFDTEWGSRKAVALTSEFLSKHGCMRVKMAFALFVHRNCIWLTRERQNSFPRATSGIHATWACRHKFGNGDEHHAVVAQANRKTSVARHSSCREEQMLSVKANEYHVKG